jgi:Cu+-exporting ATPase
MLSELSRSHNVVLLSGDNDRERERFKALMGPASRLCFEQSPTDKLQAIEALQGTGATVMMVGDGLNDAGALRQSDVGVAVVEEVGTFSPASDVIMEARHVPALATLVTFARRSVFVVWASILLSLAYNVVGLGFAASGRLSPIVCAILMPLSSITVVTFASMAVGWMARRVRLSAALNPERIS